MTAPKHNLTPVAAAASQNSAAAPTAMFLSDQFETYLKVVEMKLDGRVQRLVDLRSLHEKLGVKDNYRDWAPRSLANSRSVEGTHYLPRVDQRQVPHQGGTRTVESKEFYACFEKAKIIAARSNAENSLDICEWLVRVEDQVRQSQAGPLIPKDFPSALRAYADEYEAHQTTKTLLISETKRANEAEATIEANVLFDRVRATASPEVLHISLAGIKRLICPPLSIDAIQALLTKANHPRRPVRIGYGRGSVTKSSFVREGVEEVICQAFRDAVYYEIDSGKRIRMEHDAFVLKEVLLDWNLTEEFTDRYSLHISVH